MDEDIKTIIGDARALEGQTATGSTQSPPSEPGALAAQIAGSTQMVLGFLASRAGEHWNCTAAEAREFGNSWERFINEKFPDFETGATFAVVMATVGLIAPRAVISYANKKQAALSSRPQGQTAPANLKETQPAKPQKPAAQPNSTRGES